METIKVIHDVAGRTLTIWLDDPSKEHIRPANGKGGLAVETIVRAGA